MSKIFQLQLTRMASSQQPQISTISTALKSVLCKIETATSKRPESLPAVQPRLVAVTKTKPAESIITAYECGQRYFGENYVTELVEKGQNPDLLKLSDIKWHFIGHLQRNKVGKLLSVPNLHTIETVDSTKLAESLDNGWKRLGKADPLKIMIQVNTSNEENKAGCPPDQVVDIYKFVQETCINLEVTGLMTIGSFNHDLSTGPNPDFQSLFQCREDLCKQLGMNVGQLELSMGMSADFEHAIELGSTNVRVGSTIFGSREVKKKATTTKTENSADSTESGSIVNMSNGMAGLAVGES
ncbi:pyridoxal phosphate homeostasis protein-like [Ylistrum balloti]|uniref:pyridoxal phosphate homeostasis protein-like n=1 Tax=Ylistrum balloti TaxID=509963 RepID=UPI002905EFB8|nr:pyridoxal phosphate homeostasis protein-like [Ylistrum balloti]